MSLLHTASLSFSGTSHALEVLQSRGNLDRAPSVEACIQWDMKVGLHKLTRDKEPADDWVWIMDHVVNKGVHKCFLVLGVRMSVLQGRNDLTLRIQDLEPLGVVPMKESNGRLVAEELERVLEVTGGRTPLAILKDQGSDLRCGGKDFCREHPEVININDVPHKIACIYKKIFDQDVDWDRFVQECANFKKKVQLTQHAHLAPPNQRSKARYQNIDVLMDWAMKWLPYCDMNKELSWLKRYTNRLTEWSQLVEAGRGVRDIVRRQGLSKGCYHQISDHLLNIVTLPKAEQFACDILDFLEGEGEKIPEGKVVLGSSEIIESVFGMHKIVSSRGPKPMGRLVLSMASRIGEAPSEKLIAEAFERIQERTIDNWITQAFSKCTMERVDFMEENWNHSKRAAQ